MTSVIGTDRKGSEARYGLGAMLSNQQLVQEKLSRGHCIGERVENFFLEGCDLTGVNLVNAVLAGGHLRDTLIEGADLRDVTFVSLSLKSVSFKEVSFRNVRFENCVLEDVTFEPAEGTSDVGSVSFERCRLLGGDLGALAKAKFVDCLTAPPVPRAKANPPAGMRGGGGNHSTEGTVSKGAPSASSPPPQSSPGPSRGPEHPSAEPAGGEVDSRFSQLEV